MKNNKINRLKKVKLFLIYNVRQYNRLNKTHSLTNTVFASICSIRRNMECDF